MADEPDAVTVRDAAARLDVTPRTLKYYEERGLVVPTRSGGRYRLYSAADLQRFERIFRLRSLGFSLQAIAEMLKRPLETVDGGQAGYSLRSMRQIAAALEVQLATLDERIAGVRHELREAQALRRQLADDIDYLNRRLEGETREALQKDRQRRRGHTGAERSDPSRTRGPK